jgi:hypothetical protein
MSTPPGSALADRQPTIDDLQCQLAERTAERDEGLAREAAMAEVLGVINSSPADLAPVFDAMLDKAMRFCEADYGHVYTFDGQEFHTAAIQGDRGFVEWRRRLGPVRPKRAAETNPPGRLMQGEHVAQVADARKEEELLGAIIVYRREVWPFFDK